MLAKLQKNMGGLIRHFSLRCMLIHPVIGTRAVTLKDVKDAEEAVGLCNALDFSVIPWQSGGSSIYDQEKASSRWSHSV